MAIISIKSPEARVGHEVMIEYPIAVHQAHEKAPTTILVPSLAKLQSLKVLIHEAGSGHPGYKHTLYPDEYEAVRYIGRKNMGLITQVMTLILSNNTESLLLDIR